MGAFVMRALHDPQPGDRIGDYKLEKQLGQGATGTVHKAFAIRGPLRGRVIAIKIIQKSLLNTEKRRRRVDCEIEIHKSLTRYPAIVRFEHAFEDEQCIYILTEFCPGATLFQFLLHNHPTGLPEADVQPIFLAIVQAVAFLHLNEVLHRDLKLTNVLLTDTRQVRIADFGLATKLEDAALDQEMTMCGTPNYVSPEVVKRSPYGVASDVWSLGCMLVALLTGRPPFQGDRIAETLHLVSKGAYKPLPRSASKDVRGLVDAILQVDPRRRPTTSEILAHPFLAAGSAQASRKNSPAKHHPSLARHTAIFPPSMSPQTSKGSPRLSPLRLQRLRNEFVQRRSQDTRADRFEAHHTVEHKFEFGRSVQDRSHDPWSMAQAESRHRNRSRLDSIGSDRSLKRPRDMNGVMIEPGVTHGASRIPADFGSNNESFSMEDFKKQCQVISDDEPPNEQARSGCTQSGARMTGRTSTRFGTRSPISTFHYPHRLSPRESRIRRHSRQTSDPVRSSPRSSDVPRRYSDGASSYTRREAHTTPALQDLQRKLQEAYMPPLPQEKQQDDSGLRESGPARSELPSTHASNPSSSRTPNQVQQMIKPSVTAESKLQPIEDLLSDIRKDDEANINGPTKHRSKLGDFVASMKSPDMVEQYKFHTTDIKPVTQTSKHGQVSILDSGDVRVCLHSDSREHLISADGNTITVKQMTGESKIYTFEELPARSLQAYRFASKFVKLARSRTVKIALDSDLAKCRLYQNEAFEVVMKKQLCKVSFDPELRAIKIANHDQVLWKGYLDDVPTNQREIVRHALIWWARCKDALDEPAPEIGLGRSTDSSSSPSILQHQGPHHETCAKFVDGQGWCEKLDDGKRWTMFFIDGTLMELFTETRILRFVHADGPPEEYALAAGLPTNIRQRLKAASRAMKQFV